MKCSNFILATLRQITAGTYKNQLMTIIDFRWTTSPVYNTWIAVDQESVGWFTIGGAA